MSSVVKALLQNEFICIAVFLHFHTRSLHETAIIHPNKSFLMRLSFHDFPIDRLTFNNTEEVTRIGHTFRSNVRKCIHQVSPYTLTVVCHLSLSLSLSLSFPNFISTFLVRNEICSQQSRFFLPHLKSNICSLNGIYDIGHIQLT